MEYLVSFLQWGVKYDAATKQVANLRTNWSLFWTLNNEYFYWPLAMLGLEFKLQRTMVRLAPASAWAGAWLWHVAAYYSASADGEVAAAALNRGVYVPTVGIC